MRFLNVFVFFHKRDSTFDSYYFHYFVILNRKILIGNQGRNKNVMCASNKFCSYFFFISQVFLHIRISKYVFNSSFY